MALPIVSTVSAPTGMVVDGITIAYMQGDQKASKYYQGLSVADVDKIADAIEASGEYTVIGFSVNFRLKTYKEKTLTIAQGTADKITWQNVICQRTIDVGGVEVKAQSLYLLMPISSDATKKTALKDVLLGEVIAGAKITQVSENLVSAIV